MPPKELKDHSPFSGFIAHYETGKAIKEVENFFSKKLNKPCATNWAEIEKRLLCKIELYWNDSLKGVITKEPSKNSFNTDHVLAPSDWFFSQKGYFDLGSRTIKVIARNIGYVKDSVTHILSVNEDTGIVHISQRKA